jgi:iron complex outermembrane receptor protein
MKQNFKLKLSSIATALALSTVMSVAIAAEEKEKVNSLETIVVTAQKTQESIQEIPMTVQALSGDFIEKAGIEDVLAVAAFIPSLGGGRSSQASNTSLFIRGVGSGRTDPSLEPSVALFVDGVYNPRSGLGLTELTDVQRVEVLMGPQGTLYGKNATAGVINVITNRPSIDYLDASIKQTFGNYDLNDTQLMLNVPLSDTAAGRISVRKIDRKGYIDDTILGEEYHNDNDSLVARAQLLFQPSDELEILASAYYVDKKQRCCAAEVEYDSPGVGSLYASLADAFGVTHSAVEDKTDRKVTQDREPLSTLKSEGFSLQIDYDLGWGQLASITAIGYWESDFREDTDDSALDILRIQDYKEEQSWSQELRLHTSLSDDVKLISGLFYFDSELARVVPFAQLGIIGELGLNVGKMGDTGFYNNKWENQSWAIFSQATWQISDALDIIAGIRYSEDKKHTLIRVFNNVPADRPGYSFIGATFPATDEVWDIDDAEWTGNLTARYYFNEDSMLFGTVSTGFKGGGTNGGNSSVAIDDRNYDPETVINYEVGFKNTLMDDRLRLNASYFNSTFNDFQAQVFDPASTSFFVRNAGELVSKGMDMTVELAVTDSLTIIAAASVLDTYYGSFEQAPCAISLGRGNPCDRSGERAAFAPELKTSLVADYTLSLANSELFIRGEYLYSDDYSANINGDPLAETGYTVFNARAGWKDDHWSVTLWAKNLTDEYYFDAHSGSVLGPLIGDNNSHRVWGNAPRTFGITVGYNWW